MSSIKFLFFLLQLVQLIHINFAYTWLIQSLYADAACSDNAVVSLLLQQMNKCFQVSDKESTLSDCTLNKDKTITKYVYTWKSNDCSGEPSVTTQTLTSLACNAGVTAECVTNPSYESWPGWSQKIVTFLSLIL